MVPWALSAASHEQDSRPDRPVHPLPQSPLSAAGRVTGLLPRAEGPEASGRVGVGGQQTREPAWGLLPKVTRLIRRLLGRGARGRVPCECVCSGTPGGPSREAESTPVVAAVEQRTSEPVPLVVQEHAWGAPTCGVCPSPPVYQVPAWGLAAGRQQGRLRGCRLGWPCDPRQGRSLCDGLVGTAPPSGAL